MLVIERATGPDDDVRALIEELTATLGVHYTPEQTHGLKLDALFRPGILFFVARLDGRAVGCGGVAMESDFAEVKRMFVRPEARGRGVAQALLARIEDEARRADLRWLKLETGDRQLDAMRMYERAGFTKCAAFGAYASMRPDQIDTSVFYEKRLQS